MSAKLKALYATADQTRQAPAVAAFINEAMNAHQLTVGAACALLRVSASTLRAWRRAERVPSFSSHWRSLRQLSDPDEALSARIVEARAAYRSVGRPAREVGDLDAELTVDLVDLVSVRIGADRQGGIQRVATELGRSVRTVQGWMQADGGQAIPDELMRRLVALARVER